MLDGSRADAVFSYSRNNVAFLVSTPRRSLLPFFFLPPSFSSSFSLYFRAGFWSPLILTFYSTARVNGSRFLNETNEIIRKAIWRRATRSIWSTSNERIRLIRLCINGLPRIIILCPFVLSTRWKFSQIPDEQRPWLIISASAAIPRWIRAFERSWQIRRAFHRLHVTFEPRWDFDSLPSGRLTLTLCD